MSLFWFSLFSLPNDKKLSFMQDIFFFLSLLIVGLRSIDVVSTEHAAILAENDLSWQREQDTVSVKIGG